MDQTAEVVVIGGGINGLSTAYNLARLGCRDVVLIEQGYLASGSTGRCGAGVREQWGTEMNCRLAKASIKMFEHLNEELEYDGDIEFKQKGYLILAHTEKEYEQFKKNVALQNSLGIPSELVTPERAKEIVPMLDIEGLLAATYCPEDGHINPFKTVEAYARAARRFGVRIETYTRVTGIKKEGDRITGVVTDRGEIDAPVLVNTAGAYANPIGKMVGLDLPVYPERHQILVTEPVEPIQDPMVMSFSRRFYCQQTPHGSFIMGMGDPNEPKDFDLGHSWQFLKEMSRTITHHLPAMAGLRVVRQWAGLYENSPDRQPIIGGAPGLPGFYMAIGFSGHGFMLGPMAGKVLAEMILGMSTSIDVNMLDLGRFDRGEPIIEPSVV